MWLGNPKMNRMVGAPISITRLVSIPKYLDSPTTLRGRRLVKFKMYAPAEVGTYQFSLQVESDAHIGCSTSSVVKMSVQKFDPVEEESRKKVADTYWKEYEEDEEEWKALMGGGAQSLLGGGSMPDSDTSSDDGDSDSSDSD